MRKLIILGTALSVVNFAITSGWLYFIGVVVSFSFESRNSLFYFYLDNFYQFILINQNSQRAVYICWPIISALFTTLIWIIALFKFRKQS